MLSQAFTKAMANEGPRTGMMILPPKDLSKRIKFSLRAKMQVAILKGNARIAALVGI